MINAQPPSDPEDQAAPVFDSVSHFPVPKWKNKPALLGFLLSLLSVVLTIISYTVLFSIAWSIGAVISSCVGILQAKHAGTGKALAVAGIVVGAAVLAGNLIWLFTAPNWVDLVVASRAK